MHSSGQLEFVKPKHGLTMPSSGREGRCGGEAMPAQKQKPHRNVNSSDPSQIVYLQHINHEVALMG